MNGGNIIEAKYAVISQEASKLSEMLEPLTSMATKGAYQQLTTLQDQFRTQRRQVELSKAAFINARQARLVIVKKVSAAIGAAVLLGVAFDLPDVADIVHQAQARHLTLESLEKLFAGHEKKWHPLGKDIDGLGNDLRRVLEAEASLRKADEDAVRQYKATFFRIQSELNLARSLLVVEGLELPSFARPKKKKKKVDAAAVPTLNAVPTITPGPANEGARLA